MKVSIVRDGGILVIDGRGLDDLDVSQIPEDVHAVQWDGLSGEVEYVDGSGNQVISSLPEWASNFVAIGQAIFDQNAQAETEAKASAESYEGKSAAIRAERDLRIAETDWWALSDSTMSAEQAAYRQALRDVTGQDTFPNSVTWPSKP